MATGSDITAASQRYSHRLDGSSSNSRQQVQQDTSWQDIAWGYYDDTPEVRFAATWIGNSMGRARLFAGIRQDDGTVTPVPPDHRAARLVASIAGGPAGQSQLLAEFGPHLVVAGEGWVIIEPDAQSPTGPEEWHLLSTSEVNRQQKKATIVDRIVSFDGDDDEDPLAIRVWQPHPRRHIDADSPIRSSFVLLDELRLLNAAVAAIAKSRLTGRGVMFVPHGTRFPTRPGEPQQDDLLDQFITVAETAYRQPDSAAAAIPIILEVPPETIGLIQRLTFESEFDTLAVKLREETIRRFATGLDTPAEVLLGMGEINHWGQWATDESAIRLAVEPRLALVCDAFTDQWMRPVLESEHHPDAGIVTVWYDASGVRNKQNRPDTALAMNAAGIINDDTTRREGGWGDDAIPTKEEAERALLISLVRGAPSLAPLILPILGIDITGGSTIPSAVEGDEVVAPEPELDVPVDETHAPPEREEVDRLPEVIASLDGLVWRALERAGQRMRSRSPRAGRPQLQQMSAASIHTVLAVEPDELNSLGLLDGAWERVPEIAGRFGLDTDVMTTVLDRHVRSLLQDQREHAIDDLYGLVAGIPPRERAIA